HLPPPPFPTRRSSDLLHIGVFRQLARPAPEEVGAIGADVVGAHLADGAVIRVALPREQVASRHLRVNAKSDLPHVPGVIGVAPRSEEHTSELQSPYDL